MNVYSLFSNIGLLAAFGFNYFGADSVKTSFFLCSAISVLGCLNLAVISNKQTLITHKRVKESAVTPQHKVKIEIKKDTFNLDVDTSGTDKQKEGKFGFPVSEEKSNQTLDSKEKSRDLSEAEKQKEDSVKKFSRAKSNEMANNSGLKLRSSIFSSGLFRMKANSFKESWNRLGILGQSSFKLGYCLSCILGGQVSFQTFMIVSFVKGRAQEAPFLLVIIYLGCSLTGGLLALIFGKYSTLINSLNRILFLLSLLVFVGLMCYFPVFLQNDWVEMVLLSVGLLTVAEFLLKLVSLRINTSQPETQKRIKKFKIRFVPLLRSLAGIGSIAFFIFNDSSQKGLVVSLPIGLFSFLMLFLRL